MQCNYFKRVFNKKTGEDLLQINAERNSLVKVDEELHQKVVDNRPSVFGNYKATLLSMSRHRLIASIYMPG